MRGDERDEMLRLKLFAQAAPDRADELLKSAFLQRFPAHAELTREGEPADFLHVVVEGQVEMFAASHDRETTVAVLGPGHSFIVAAVLLDRVYLQAARALSPCRVLMLPAEAVRQGFAADAGFARALAMDLALAYRSLVKELKNQKLRSGTERLANWLLVFNDQTGGNGRFALPYDKKVLASRLGMAPEVLSRTFASLRNHGVRLVGRSVTIDDVAALQTLAKPVVTIDDVSA